MIAKRDWVTFIPGVPTVVHESCSRIQRAVVARGERENENRGVTETTVPHGLTPQTLETYARIWDGYLQFARRNGCGELIPGRDTQWDRALLWKYMQFRAQTCKPGTVVSNLSALTHFGSRRNYVLPTSRFDGDPSLRRDVTNMKRQLHLDYREKHGGVAAAYGPDQCCPMDNTAVCIILTALKIFSRKSFMAKSRFTRMHVVGSVMQHSRGMRFGHFIARMYTWQAFLWSHGKQSYTLVTDWHRYSGKHRYFLSFPVKPKLLALRYVLHPTPTSTVVLSAGTIMRWHFQWMRSVGETVVFCPRGPGVTPDRAARQKWLRLILSLALPKDDTAARAAISEVTPHAFRPGLANDLIADGMPFQDMMRFCRWASERVARMYAARPTLGMLRTRSIVHQLHESSPGVYVADGSVARVPHSRRTSKATEA